MERPLWAEQRPENWWDAAQTSIRGVLSAAGVSGNAIRGIGLSGQMHGLVLLDGSDRVIRPALIWCDQRSQAQVESINASVGKETVLASIANPVLTGFTLPKLLWVRDNEPELFARVRKVLLPKDYLRFQLTGEYVSDVSDASGTALFDVVHRGWSSELAGRLELDTTILPVVLESHEVSVKCRAAPQSVPVLQRVLLLLPGPEIRRQAPSAMASSSRGSSRARSERPASFSHTPNHQPTILRGACTPSVTQSPEHGT